MAEAAVDHVQIPIGVHDHAAAPQPPAAGKVNRPTDRLQADRIDPLEPPRGGTLGTLKRGRFARPQGSAALQEQLALLALHQQHRPATRVTDSRNQPLATSHPQPRRGNQLLPSRAAALSRPRGREITIQFAPAGQPGHEATLPR